MSCWRVGRGGIIRPRDNFIKKKKKQETPNARFVRLACDPLVYYKAIFTGIIYSRPSLLSSSIAWLLSTLIRLRLFSAESRELNTKLINPKECLDFLARCCARGVAGAAGRRSRRAAKHSDPRVRFPRGCRTAMTRGRTRGVHTPLRTHLRGPLRERIERTRILLRADTVYANTRVRSLLGRASYSLAYITSTSQTKIMISANAESVMNRRSAKVYGRMGSEDNI